jgi:CheY-like chemotaxis protein
MKLLIVEQDATQAEIYKLSLEDEFDIIQVDSKSAALKALKENDISVVISDWCIGDSTAAIFGSTENKTKGKKAPLVIVVSDDGSDETMRKAFHSGVSHYITKPYNVVLLTETVINSKHQIETLTQMESDNSKSRETAKTALSQAAIYGTGMEIVSSLNTCTTIEVMAKKVLTTLRLNGVHAAIQFRDGEEIHNIDTDLTPCDETTDKVFQVLHDQGRIYRFGRRLMLNDNSVSLLVKNIAKEDPVLYDAILDMGAKLVPAINARYESVLQQNTLVTLNTDLNHVLDRVQKCIRKVGAEKMQIISDVSSRIKSSFHALEMTEEQEAFFIDLIEKELESREDNDELITIDTMLTEISETLKARVSEAVSHSDEEEEEYLDVEFF